MILAVLAACSTAVQVDATVDPGTGVVTVSASSGQPVLRRAGGPAVAGRRSADGRTFVSAGPLKPGVAYVASAGATQVPVQRAAAPAGRPPTVTLGPAVDRVPSNHLKFYVSFSRPMRQIADPLRGVQLIDETVGEPVSLAFHDLANWARDGRSLTLLLHPGRQKRGIGFASGIGPVLTEGHTYTLRVDPGLQATDGVAVSDAAELRFVAGPADREPMHPERWTVEAPVATDGGVLTVHLDEPAEPRLLAGAFVVLAADSGRVLATVSEVAPGASAVALRTDRPWPERVVVRQQGPIEDLAGNTPGRAFDHPAGALDTAAAFQATVHIADPGA